VSALAENSKGVSGQTTSSWASNARKEPSHTIRENCAGVVGGRPSRNRGVRTLPYLKYVKRKEEGRCFHCGGLYSYGHKCPEKNLRVIIIVKDEKELEIGERGLTNHGRKGDQNEET